MNRTEHLLTCLMEECAEIQKAAAKALRFGLDDHAPGSDATNADDISHEIIDLLAIIEMLKAEKIISDINQQETELLIEAKKEKVEIYMVYSKERGSLTL